MTTKILVSSGCKLDGIGDAAAAYYISKNLLINYDCCVTLLICINEPTSRQIISHEKIQDYINNIDPTGYLDLDDIKHDFNERFKIIGTQAEDDATNQDIKNEIDQDMYHLHILGPVNHNIVWFKFENIKKIEFYEFGYGSGDGIYSFDAGLGDNAIGIYFDTEMRMLANSFHHKKISFLKNFTHTQIIQEKFNIKNDKEYSDIDIYMSYGNSEKLIDFYIQLAKRFSNDNNMIFFMKSTDYILEIVQQHKYEKIIDKIIYKKNNIIFVIGSLSENNFRKIILLSNKIVHCTGNTSISQVLSAKKIPIYDYLPHARKFRLNLYNMMKYYDISFSKFFTGEYTIESKFNADEIIDDAFNTLYKDIHKKSIGLENFFESLNKWKFIPNLISIIADRLHIYIRIYNNTTFILNSNGGSDYYKLKYIKYHQKMNLL